MEAGDFIDEIIAHEGTKLTSDPRGGVTKFGITQRRWSDYRRSLPREAFELAPIGVEDITLTDARVFYLEEYVDPTTWLKDWPGVRRLVIDSNIQHGEERTTRWIQAACGAIKDGILGENTQKAVLENPLHVYRELMRSRMRFYAQIATDAKDGKPDPDAKYLVGWLSRLADFIQ